MTGTEKQPAWIKDYKEYHTDSKVHFVINLAESQLSAAEKEGLEKKFKLTTTISTSNLVCFDLEGRIRKYDGVADIIKDFYDLRKEYYQKRKEHMLGQLTFELERLENKARFVTSIINGTLKVQNRKKKDLLQELKTLKFKAIYKKKTEVEDDEEEEGGDHGYDYLLTMPIWSLTMEKVEQLLKDKASKEDQVKHLIGQTVNDLWTADLDAFLAKWDEFEKQMEEAENTMPDNSTHVGKKKKTISTMFKKPKKKGSDDDSGEDYGDKPKKPTKKAIKVKEEVKAEPKPKKVVKKKVHSDEDSEPKPKKVVKKKVDSDEDTDVQVVSKSNVKKDDFVVTKKLKTGPSSASTSHSQSPEQPIKKRALGKPKVQQTITSLFSKANAKKKIDSDQETLNEPAESPEPKEIKKPARRPVAKKSYTLSDDEESIEQDESFMEESFVEEDSFDE